MTRVRWDCVDRAVSTGFKRIGRFIGLHPGYFVIVPLLLAGLLVTGVQRIIYEEDPEYLFSPENGRSKTDRNIIEELFPFNNSDFDIGRMTKPGRFGRVIIQPKDKGSVLRKVIFDNVVALDDIIHNMTIKWERKFFKYVNLCSKSNGLCFENTILDYADRIGAIENKTFMLEYPLMTEKVTLRPVFFAAYLGGAQVDDLGYLESAAAINMMYYLDTTEEDDVERAILWEDMFLDVTQHLDFEHIEITQFVSSTLQTELERNNQSVLPFFSITILIMLIFSVVTCMMTDWVRSRPWLGVLGCLSSCFAVAASFGLTMYCGLPFIGINMAAPFLMLGIGMDDTFVLLAAWRRTSPKQPVHHRLGDAFADAAVSITITSLTNFLSFLIGAITPFPCVRIFCLYTAMAVLFTYVYHITFFGGCMAINGYAESRNLHSLVCLQVMPKSLAVNRNCFYRALCTGGLNPDDPDNPDDNKEPYMMSFFKDTVGGILGVWPIKVLIIMVFLGYLAIGIWGCTLLKEGLERRRLSRSDSYSIKFYDMEDNFFRRYPYRIQVVINETLNFADPVVQRRVETLLEMLEGTEYIADSSLTECWYREYHRFLADERTSAILSGFNMTLEDDYVRGLKDVFLKFPAASFFKKDIVFNKEQTHIIATRFVVQAMNVTNANQEKEMVLTLRNIVDRFPFPVSLFHVYFIFFDQFILVRETSIQAISVAAAVMMIISLIFIPSASCAIWVAFSIVSIEIGVIGYMTLWNVNLDSISMINLIMCIGFSVDFSAHISYAYITSEETDPEARLRSALHSLGMPIFQGSMSTILGIIALAFAPSYIFLTFFKTVFLVILFGALHGILLLPVLLSMSDSCFGSRTRKKKLTVSVPTHDRRTPQPFFISKDGNTIVTSNGQPPVFIPRPIYSNGKGPARSSSELDLSARSRRPSRVKESAMERVVHTASAGARTSWGAGASNVANRGGKRPTSVIRETNDRDPGLGTSGEEENSSGSWKFDYARDNEKLNPRRPGPNSLAGPSRRASRMEDHVNPAFLPDEELDSHVPPSRGSSGGSSSAKGRLAAYHDVTASTILGSSSHGRSKPSTSSRGSPPGRVSSLGQRRVSLDWDQSPLASRNGTDSPLTSHLSRINSGNDYLREFNLHAPL